MECFICYSKVCDTEMVFLECYHSLCIKCFPCLKSDICPFCRTEFSQKFKKEIKDRIRLQKQIKKDNIKSLFEPNVQSSIIVNFRQDNESLIHYIYNFENNEFVFERQRNLRKKFKRKNNKNNFRKGNWAIHNSVNRQQFKI